MARMKHYRKAGPGRLHNQGEPGLPRRFSSHVFKGVTFAPDRPLSALHPTVIAKRQAALMAAGL